MYKIEKLDNGLTILMVPKEGADSVIVDAYVKVGSRHEDQKINGIAHFLEHLNFKGTKKFPSAKKVSGTVDSVGGYMNANTWLEHTQYFVKAASKHQDLALEVVTELFLNPRLREKDIEMEKGVVLEEINMYNDDPKSRVGLLFQEAFWQDHPLGRSTLGTHTSIKNLSRQDIVDYRLRWYAPENTVLVVVGSFDEKKFLQKTRRLWGDFKGEISGQTEPVATAKQDLLAVEKRDTNQAHFILGFRGLPAKHKDQPVETVLKDVLSGGMSARLWQEVREKRGLGYYVYADSDSFSDTGVFNIAAGVEKNRIVDAVEVIVKELGKLKKNLVNAAELRDAKEHYKGVMTLSLESSSNLMGWYLEKLVYGESEKLTTPQQWFKKIDKVKAAEVRRLAREIFTPENATLAVVGPYGEKDKKEFEKAIKKL